MQTKKAPQVGAIHPAGLRSLGGALPSELPRSTVGTDELGHSDVDLGRTLVLPGVALAGDSLLVGPERLAELPHLLPPRLVVAVAGREDVGVLMPESSRGLAPRVVDP